MTNFLFSAITFIIYLLSMFIIINFLFSKEGFYWIVPFLLNLFFVGFQAFSIYSINGAFIPNIENFNKVLPPFFTTQNANIVAFVFSIFWLILVLTFHQAFRKHKKPKDLRKAMMKKNYYGAVYTQLLEQRTFELQEKRRKVKEEYGAKVPQINSFSNEWVNLFEND